MAGTAALAEPTAYFNTHPAFEMERLIGNGANGLAALVRKRKTRGDALPKRCIAKRSLAAGVDDETYQEIRILQATAAHLLNQI